MIPDFAFDHLYTDFRVYFEIMGFWTPEYVTKKLDQLERVENVELLVAVDESLAASEAIEARDHRVVTYSSTVRIKDVRNALRRYEDALADESAAALPDSFSPDENVLGLSALAARYGVSERVVAEAEFPDHERVGRTLVRPAVLAELADRLSAGQSLADAETVLAEAGITETSAVLARLDYRVEWAGLSGGTLRSSD